MGEAFLHGQGGSGGNKTYKGWKTGTTTSVKLYSQTTTPKYLTSIEADGEIATLRIQLDSRCSCFFFDFANNYYLNGLIDSESDAADVKRNSFDADNDMIQYTDQSIYVKLYVKRNSDKKKLDIYGVNTNTKSGSYTTVVVSYEIAYY